MVEESSHRTDIAVEDVGPDVEMADIEANTAARICRPQHGSACQQCTVHGSESESDPNNSASTKSLSEHIIEDVIENGRRYCNETYFMPNDEAEQTRLSIVHQIYLITYDGQPTRSTLPDSHTRILDIGTGPGDWPLAMAEERPEAEILSMDIGVFDSDALEMAPANVYFQIDNAEDEWEYHGHFDFIHIRGLSGAIANWERLYRTAFEHLEPGGIIEIADTDFASALLETHVPENSYLSIYISAIRNAADVAGYPLNLDHLGTPSLTAAGFVDVRTYDIGVPVGTWPTDPRESTLGKMALIVLLEGLEAVSMRLLTKYMAWSPEQVLDLCEKVKMEVVTGTEIIGLIRVAVARKPEPNG